MTSLTAEATAPGDIWLPLLTVIGIVGAGVFLTFTIRGRIAARQAQRPTARELIEHVKASAGSHTEDGHGRGVQLVETARRLAAQLDAKAERLEQLIREADRRIAGLEKTPGDAAAAPPPVPAPPHPRPAPSPAPPKRVLDALTEAVYERADSGLSPVQIAEQLDEQVGKVELILALRE